MPLPLRPLGSTGCQVTALGPGGVDLGDGLDHAPGAARGVDVLDVDPTAGFPGHADGLVDALAAAGAARPLEREEDRDFGATTRAAGIDRHL